MTTKSAFIAIIGRPNAGKSTLLNALLGEKVAIVSSKPQTTRNRITGILTEGENQYVFLDTPGIHTPKTKLGDYMMRATNSSIGDASVAILVAEADKPIGKIEQGIIEQLKQTGIPAILVLNKMDTANKIQLAAAIQSYADAFDFAAVVPASALKKQNVEIVLDEVKPFLEESPWFFPDDMLTDQSERKLASEIIREKLLRSLSDEIPHGTAVAIEEFKEEENMISIRAEIYCEKASHKGIIVGKGGAMLKKVGTDARLDLERFFGTKVYLNLWVKVKEKWRDSTFNLTDLGYDPKDL